MPRCRRALAAADRIFALALELGGTITAEHGVGRLKRAWASGSSDGMCTSCS